MSMNCLAFRRLLLAAPRERTPAQQTHLQGCLDCAQLATDLSALDRKIGRAMRLPVPDGMADRILLPRLRVRRWHYGAAAAALAAAIALGLMAPGLIDPDETALAADAVGRTHPAVAAISMVVEREPALLKEGRTGDPLVLAQRLKHLGLELKKSDVSIRYIGQCEIGGAACDHLVLVTPEGHASVILMAGGHPPARVLVAESPKAVKRARRLFVNG